MKLPYKYVSVERSRHGRAVYYFRKPRCARIRLPDDYGSPEFLDAYFFALHADRPIIKPHIKVKDLPAVETRRLEISRSVRACLRSAKARAAALGRPFDLTEAWILAEIERQGRRCALTGIPFFTPIKTTSSKRPFAPSIDRIDCQGGYTRDNVRIVLFAVNVMLLDWGEEIFLKVLNGYRDTRRTNARTLSPDSSG